MGLLALIASLCIVALPAPISAKSIGHRRENPPESATILQNIWLVNAPFREDSVDGFAEPDIGNHAAYPAPPANHRAMPPPEEQQVVVWCSGDTISLRVKKMMRAVELKRKELTLGSGCKSNGVSGNEFFFTYSLSECGTKRSMCHGKVVYSNVLHYLPSASKSPIRKSSPFNVPIKCTMNRFPQDEVAPSIKGHHLNKNMPGFTLRTMHEDWIGEANTNVYYRGKPIHFQATAQLLSSEQRLFIQSCYATSLPDPNSRPRSKVIVKKGCMPEQIPGGSRARFVAPRTKNTINFVVNAFGLQSSEIYMHCVLVAVNNRKVTEGTKSCNYNYAKKRWEELDGNHAACKCCREQCASSGLKSLLKASRVKLRTGPLIILADSQSFPKEKWDLKQPKSHKHSKAMKWSSLQETKVKNAKRESPKARKEYYAFDPVVSPEYGIISSKGPVAPEGQMEAQPLPLEDSEGFQEDWSWNVEDFAPKDMGRPQIGPMEQDWNIPLADGNLDVIFLMQSDESLGNQWAHAEHRFGSVEWFEGEEPVSEAAAELDFDRSFTLQSDVSRDVKVPFLSFSKEEPVLVGWDMVEMDEFQGHEKASEGNWDYPSSSTDLQNEVPGRIDLIFRSPAIEINDYPASPSGQLTRNGRGKRLGKNLRTKPTSHKTSRPLFHDVFSENMSKLNAKSEFYNWEGYSVRQSDWFLNQTPRQEKSLPLRKAVLQESKNLNSDPLAVFRSILKLAESPEKTRSLEYKVERVDFDGDNIVPEWRSVALAWEHEAQPPNLRDLLGLSRAE
ncbi:uncharacterized protein LOC136763342 [Amia ocellicauda]|uniref:uncharacterized protein LOC136763342 n=1 Tax=Amia ocellicauda TaxID=2972642 RepID=UPI003463A7B1